MIFFHSDIDIIKNGKLDQSQLDTVCIEENAFYGEYDNYLKKKKGIFYLFKWKFTAIFKVG